MAEDRSKGYHRYGFGSFLPNIASRLKGINKKNVNRSSDKNVTFFLPEIQVSQLIDNQPSKKEPSTSSARLLEDEEENYEHGSEEAQGTVLPSLIGTSMFKEEKTSKAPWWKWSRQDKNLELKEKHREPQPARHDATLQPPLGTNTFHRTLSALDHNAKDGLPMVSMENKEISIFDFKLIAAHKPSYRKWSKLTALPQIQGNMTTITTAEQEYVTPTQDPKENNINSVPDSTLEATATTTEVVSGKVSPKVKPQYLTLDTDTLTSSVSKQKSSPVKMSKLSILPRLGYTSPVEPDTGKVAVSTGSATLAPPPSRETAVQGTDTSDQLRNKLSTVYMDSLMLSNSFRTRSARRMVNIKQRIKDLRNITLINGWIQVLESTKDIQIEDFSDISVAQPVLHSAADEKKVANVDLINFFDLPKSFLQQYDQRKSRYATTKPVSTREQAILIDELQKKDELSMQGTRMGPGQAHQLKTGPHYHKQEQNELSELLAVQKLDCPAPVQKESYSKYTPQTVRPPVVVHHTPQEFPQNRAVFRKPHLPRTVLNYDFKRAEGVDLNGVRQGKSSLSKEMHKKDLANHHVTIDLMLDVPYVDSHPGPVLKRARDTEVRRHLQQTQKVRHPFYMLEKDTLPNPYPDLQIQGSSMLEATELELREELEALIRLFMESKGKNDQRRKTSS